MGSEFSCMIKEAKVIGLALGIPCLDGLEEAEAQCALLNSASICDGCFSSDSDIFLFGARTVYRDIVLGEGGYVICYEMADIERKLGFGRNSLITLALLLGSDYSQGVHGFGPETACRIVKSTGDDTILHKVLSEGLTFVRKNKGPNKTKKGLNPDADKENDLSYKHSKGHNLGLEDQFLQVINAYLKPKCLSLDSEAVQRVCNQHPFIRAQLQQICSQFFDWSPDKTDEYILPKIAERDLRRFANLRSTSSELGVRIPLDEMPVACPVSAIIKQRKLQGRDYFEVTWQEMEGLQSSVVPADLIESACPEKIDEFMKKKCEGKKKQSRRPRLSKSAKADFSEVDTHLQGLMLGIESDSNALLSTAKPHIESDSNALPSKTTYHDSISLHNPVASEVIDLSSPSPPLRACKVAKCKENIDQHVEVIAICDSETDMSPEHEKKARELRVFIESIRGDLY